jgi:hypothetical protein
VLPISFASKAGLDNLSTSQATVRIEGLPNRPFRVTQDVADCQIDLLQPLRILAFNSPSH